MGACITTMQLVLFLMNRYIRTDCGIEYRVTDSNSVTTENDTRQLFCSLAKIEHNSHEVCSPKEKHTFLHTTQYLL